MKVKTKKAAKVAPKIADDVKTEYKGYIGTIVAKQLPLPASGNMPAVEAGYLVSFRKPDDPEKLADYAKTFWIHNEETGQFGPSVNRIILEKELIIHGRRENS